MWRSVTAFLVGVVFSPVVGRILRPVAKEAIKGAIYLGQHTKKLAHEVREDLEDLTAEATAEAKSDAGKVE